MDSIIDKCYLHDDEVLIVVADSYECPVHQCHEANHYKVCKEVGDHLRVLGLFENEKYIAIACKKGARFIIAGNFKYKGEYKQLKERVGAGEWIFTV